MWKKVEALRFCDRADRYRQSDGRSHFRRVQGHRKHGVASRSRAGGETLYPAIHRCNRQRAVKSLLYHPDEWERVQVLRKTMAALPPIEAMETLISNLQATKTNAELLLSGLK